MYDERLAGRYLIEEGSGTYRDPYILGADSDSPKQVVLNIFFQDPKVNFQALVTNLRPQISIFH